MKKLTLAVLTALSLFSFTSCTEDDENEVQTVFYDFELSASNYTIDGYWTEVYNPQIGNIGLSPDLQLTHSAKTEKYEGVEYSSWIGFCPSESTDKADHTGDDWMKYQWGNITGTGIADKSYVVACWDVAESTTEVPKVVSVGLGSLYNVLISPQQCYITNTTYGYWAMKNGTAFSKAFGPDDWCKIIIRGLDGYNVTGKVEFYLARDGQIVKDWQLVNLKPLGKCSAVYFQMESSDSGQWGMNSPAVFALDNLVVSYEN